MWRNLACLAFLWGNALLAVADQPLHQTLQLATVGGRPYPPVITALAYSSADECLAAAGDDHIIRLLRKSDLSVITNLVGHTDWVRSLHFSPSGDRLVSAGNDGQVLVWQRDEGWSEKPTELFNPAVACVRFCPQGKAIAAAGFRSELSVMGESLLPYELDCGCRDLRALAFAPKAPLIVVAGRSGHLHIVDLHSKTIVRNFPAHQARVRQVEFLTESNTAVSVAEDGSVVAMDVVTGDLVGRANIPGCKLQSLVVLDSDRIATGGSDNRVYIIDIRLGKVLQAWEGHQGSVATMTRIEDQLITGGYDTTIRVWDLKPLRESAERVAAEAVPDARTSAIPIRTEPAAR